jgi:hypothetical protein
MPHLHKTLCTPESTPVRPHADGGHQRAHTGHTRMRAVALLTVLVLACLGLTACGGSSGSSTNASATGSAATSASGASTSGGSSAQSTNGGSSAAQGTAPGAGRQRFSAIRECLQKNGVKLPERTPGSSGPAGGQGAPGGFPGAGALPKGVTRAQFEAALKKCGGGNFGARSGRPGAGFRRVNSPVFIQALAKYAACLRQNGIDIPAPNTSGKGPIFSTKGINTASPQFKAATMKCRASLVGAFRSQRASGGAAGTSIPPTGAERSR